MLHKRNKHKHTEKCIVNSSSCSMSFYIFSNLSEYSLVIADDVLYTKRGIFFILFTFCLYFYFTLCCLVTGNGNGYIGMEFMRENEWFLLVEVEQRQQQKKKIPFEAPLVAQQPQNISDKAQNALLVPHST